MDIKKTNYKTESYIIDGVYRKLKEEDVLKFYNERGYNASLSRRYIKKIFNRKDVSDEIKELFRKYSSGYPDMLIERSGIVSFVEIKLDSDALRKSQVEFLEELSNYCEVIVAYFNNSNHKGNSSQGKCPSIVSGRINQLVSVSRIKNLKPLWVVAKMYEEFGKQVFDKNILPVLSVRTNTSKEKILWFIKEKLEGKEVLHPDRIKPIISDRQRKRNDRDKVKKWQLMAKHNVPEEVMLKAKEMTLEEMRKYLVDNEVI